jgi:hypothetical protein
MPNPRVAHCVFCDDIRQEAGNKLSLMGLYVGDMFIAVKPPVALPKFVFVVWIIADIDDPPQWATTTVLMPPDRTEKYRIEVKEPVRPIPHLLEGATKLIAHQIIPIAPFVVEDSGMIEVMVETESGSMRAGRLLVHFVEPSVSAPTPAEVASAPS